MSIQSGWPALNIGVSSMAHRREKLKLKAVVVKRWPTLYRGMFVNRTKARNDVSVYSSLAALLIWLSS